jgi:AAA domain/DnaB-like helicase N terminal domain
MDSNNGSLPYSEDGERGVLCSLILSPGEVSKLCRERLQPDAFYVPAHRIVYETLLEWWGDGAVEFPWLKNEIKKRGQLEEIGGPEFLNELFKFVPTAANADYYITLVCEKYGLRRLTLTCDKLSVRCREPEAEAAPLLAEAEREITEIVHSNNGASARLPEWLKVEDVDELPDKEPERVIENLLRVGEKLGITSASKSFKTWLLLTIGFCIANGLDFLGFKTHQSKVIVFDLELSRHSLKCRLRRIQKTLGAGAFDNIKVCSLRGKAQLFCKNFEKIKAQIVADNFKVVIIDPVYKFLLGKEENSNGVVADVLERLTVFCMEAQVALLYVHHHSKGNQATKESLDRGSGAGAWSRDPDALMDITSHKQTTKEEPVYTCSITVRDFPPIEDFVVRWKFPILVRDTEGLDPTELKQAEKGGRPKDDNSDLIMAVFRACEGNGGATAKQVSEATLIPKRTIQRRIRELSPARLVKAPLIKNGFQLSLSESEKMKEFEEAQNNDSDYSEK